MKLGLLFRILGVALFIQLALGGLVTFDFVGPGVHIMWGVILGAVSVVALVYVYRLPSKPKRLVGITFGIGVDILLQALIGFAALSSGDQLVSWIHFLNALAIYGMTLAGTFMAAAAGRMADAAEPTAPSHP